MVTVCGSPPEIRRLVLDTLKAGPYNLASEQFLAAHGLGATVKQQEATEDGAEAR
jgi:hypothetical protein